MSDDNAFRQMADEVDGVFRRVIPERIAHLAKQPESPIERAFLIGLLAFSYVVPRYDFGDAMAGLAIASNPNLPVIKVALQAPIKEFRADFLLTTNLDGRELGSVVVECDGHEFHERTKEQAARDRSRDRIMTLAGYKVLRFTGSELYRDLVNCVLDAHIAAWHFYTDDTARS